MTTARVRIIEPRNQSTLAEVYEFRRIGYLLAWRDVKVRYKQTAVGVLWALIQPLVAALLLVLVLGRLITPSSQEKYLIFAYAGFVAWTYVASSLSAGGLSLVRHAPLLTKAYFPRLLVPLASVLAPGIDFAVALLIVPLLWFATGTVPSTAFVLIPVAWAMLVMTSASLAIWLSALDVRYRDVRHALPFLLQIWLFASPVVYPKSVVPTQAASWYELNPLVAPIELMRFAISGGDSPTLESLLKWTLVIGLLAFSGLAYFHHMDRTFADQI